MKAEKNLNQNSPIKTKNPHPQKHGGGTAVQRTSRPRRRLNNVSRDLLRLGLDKPRRAFPHSGEAFARARVASMLVRMEQS